MNVMVTYFRFSRFFIFVISCMLSNNNDNNERTSMCMGVYCKCKISVQHFHQCSKFPSSASLLTLTRPCIERVACVGSYDCPLYGLRHLEWYGTVQHVYTRYSMSAKIKTVRCWCVEIWIRTVLENLDLSLDQINYERHAFPHRLLWKTSVFIK